MTPQPLAAKSMLIKCQNLSLGYDGKAVVSSLDFTVEHGDYLWVVGENGSGKTTLIRGILRLINPLEGSILFCNELRQGRIGYLSQQMALKKDFPAGVLEIVLSGNLGGMGLRPFYSAKEKNLALEAMEQLGIAGLRGKCFRELSGGQQRRVLLARALCAAQTSSPASAHASAQAVAQAAPASSGAEHNKSCRLLILDEPAASLDPLVTSEVYGLLETLNKAMGITIIMVSHDIRSAEQYSNRVLHLEKGRACFYESAEYLRSEKSGKFFAGLRNNGNG